jgi:hypothetical protein
MHMTRKAPTMKTLRYLYLISGNECAFNGCDERIIDADGHYIGQICHIEAAEPNGQRYNPSSDDEARRQVENLVLLCPNHHKKTDNVEIWTVEAMRKMKADHERTFGTGFEKLVASIQDQTLLHEPYMVTTANAWSAALEYENIEPQAIDAINEWATRLGRVTRPSRELLAVIVGRKGTGRDLRPYLKVDLTEVQRASGVDDGLLDMVRELREAKILDSDFDDEDRYGDAPYVYEYLSEEHGVELFDLRQFCAVTGTPPAQIVVDLDLSVLD